MPEMILLWGTRVRIIAGLQTYLLDQPDANEGGKIGLLSDGDGATVVDGPVWKQGESDTIVWWYIETDQGLTAWVPANTSQLTLLEPAP